MKQNLLEFDGFEFGIGTSEYKQRIESTQKLELHELEAVCQSLQLNIKGPKDAICQRICEFLIAPHEIHISDCTTDEDKDEKEVEESTFIRIF